MKRGEKVRTKRILVGFIMDGNSGGIDRYLLHFLEAVWEEGMQIDFLSDRQDADLQKLLNRYHSKVYPIPSLWHPVKQYRMAKKLIRQGKYDMTYLNISTSMDCIVAFAAKRCRVPRRLLHSHSGGNDCESVFKRKIFDLLQKVCRRYLYRSATEFYACSVVAGKWMYPAEVVHSSYFHVIYNAVDRDSFQYLPDVRVKKRESLELQDAFVVGHVGNFCYQKNHEFLIRIFYEIHKKVRNSKLMLVGQGIRMEDVRRQVEELGLGEAVLFLGQRSDVSELFQAMDVFVLPSHFEGLPTVGVEAQCTKLPCVMSSSITQAVKISDRCCFQSLEEDPKVWAETILKQRRYNREDIRMLSVAECYDLKNQKKQLMDIIYK